jgi:hypothetical protein
LAEIFVEIGFGSTVVVAVVVAVGVDGAAASLPFFDAPTALPDFGASIAFDAETSLFGVFALTFGACALTFGACALTFGACALTFGACALPFGVCALTFGALLVAFGPAGAAAETLATDSAATVAIARNIFIGIPPAVRLSRVMPVELNPPTPVFSAT